MARRGIIITASAITVAALAAAILAIMALPGGNVSIEATSTYGPPPPPKPFIIDLVRELGFEPKSNNATLVAGKLVDLLMDKAAGIVGA